MSERPLGGLIELREKCLTVVRDHVGDEIGDTLTGGLRLKPQLQVVRTVISPLTIFVMWSFVGKEKPAQHFLHNETMFHDVPARSPTINTTFHNGRMVRHVTHDITVPIDHSPFESLAMRYRARMPLRFPRTGSGTETTCVFSVPFSCPRLRNLERHTALFADFLNPSSNSSAPPCIETVRTEPFRRFIRGS